MIKLDGKYGSGGGALVRTALALSTLTGKPFEVNNIRAGKGDGGGLKAQHLHAIKTLQQICNAETNEVELGTKELNFKPGKIKRGIYKIDIGTAGSITLFLQAIILPCLFAPGKVTLKVKGGTCGKWQASVYYLQNVLLPHLQRFVDKIELKVIKKGYYPKGGGEVHLEITPRFKLNEYDSFAAFYEDLNFKTTKVKLTSQGELEQIRGIVNLSAELQEKEIGERIEKTVKNLLKNYQVPINIRIEYGETFSIGGELVLWGIFSQNGKVDFDNPVILAGDALIEKNKSSEKVGKEATEKLKVEIESKTAVDRNLADQLIPFISLLPSSEIETREISNHTKTNIYVAEHFLDIGFKVEGNKIKVEEK